MKKEIGPGMFEKQAYISGNGFECDANGITLCDLDAGLLSWTYDSNIADFDILNILTASAMAAVDWSGEFILDISGVLSAGSSSAGFTLPFFGGSVIIGLEHHYLAVGAGFSFDSDEGKVTFTKPAIGPVSTVSIDFDF